MNQPINLSAAKKIRLPLKRETTQPCNGLMLSRVMREQQDIDAEISAYKCKARNIYRIQAILTDGRKIIVSKKSDFNVGQDTISEKWRCTDFSITDETLVLTSPSDRNAQIADLAPEQTARIVNDSWAAGLKYLQESRNSDGDVVQKGFREPQYAALHALAMHWTSSSKPATIVLPTGTGKTDVMIGAIIANKCKKTLIIVPTDSLRSQTIEKFERYGILRAIGAIDNDIPFPIIACINGKPTPEMVASLENCNIAVATMASIAKANDGVCRELSSIFSHVFFDEAHHKEAKTWKKFHKLCESSKLLLMTATPFRQDGKPVGGKFIYEFPLHKAQEQGYFKPIKFREVFEPNENKSDQAIAEAAVACLRSDLNAGKQHLMMARTDSVPDANRLFREIYQPFYGDLSPIVVHNKSPNKAKILEKIKSGDHKIIICVDMLGEGFDLPQLKIAALHTLHKSIGVTLQFIGRFTRYSEGLGDATFVANLANDGVPESLEELYQENADWNLIVSELSYDSISPQSKLSSLSDGLESLHSEEGINITPLTLRPKISASVYKVDSFLPNRFSSAFKGKSKIVKSWLSQNKSILIVITNQADDVEWSDTKDIKIDSWDLHIAYHDAEKGLMYVNSSSKRGFSKATVNELSVNPAIIKDENIFRAFSGLHRLTLFNVGLIGRSSNVRYQMFAGMDVKEAITPIIEGDKLKCNVSGVGYEEGTRLNVGCSRKGKVWSMSTGSIAEWKDWCDQIGAKLTNDNIQPRDFLKYTLIPESITALPNSDDAIGLMVDWPDHLFQSQVFSFDIETIGGNFSFDQCELCLDNWNPESNSFTFSVIANNASQVSLTLSILPSPVNGESFSVAQLPGNAVKIIASGNAFLADEYFQNNPPLVRLSDGSQLSGNILLKPQDGLWESYDRNNIQVYDWSAVDITQESRWKDRAIRPNSVQQRFIDWLSVDESITHIIDDDDSGESADILAIKEVDNEIIVYLWHCKYSGAITPGNRSKDLIEVCGQAQKSTKWTWSFDRLVKHVKNRDSISNGGRSTRFVKGNYQSLYTLRKSSRRMHISYRIGIVQPGLSKSGIPTEHLALLGATNAFISCITNHSLLVAASA